MDSLTRVRVFWMVLVRWIALFEVKEVPSFETCPGFGTVSIFGIHCMAIEGLARLRPPQLFAKTTWS